MGRFYLGTWIFLFQKTYLPKTYTYLHLLRSSAESAASCTSSTDVPDRCDGARVSINVRGSHTKGLPFSHKDKSHVIAFHCRVAEHSAQERLGRWRLLTETWFWVLTTESALWNLKTYDKFMFQFQASLLHLISATNEIRSIIPLSDDFEWPYKVNKALT